MGPPVSICPVSIPQGAADMDEALASNIMKKQRFRADDLNADDEYDFDRGIDMYERKRGDQVISNSKLM